MIYLPNQLTSLTIKSMEITDDGLSNFPSTLLELNIHNIDTITDNGLKNVFLSCGSSLQRLELENTAQITDESLQTLSSKLTHLKLSGQYHIGWNFSQNFNLKSTKFIQNLKVLHLEAINSITDDVIQLASPSLCKISGNI